MEKNDHKITLVYWEICWLLSAQLGSQIKNVTRHFLIIAVAVVLFVKCSFAGLDYFFSALVFIEISTIVYINFDHSSRHLCLIFI